MKKRIKILRRLAFLRKERDIVQRKLLATYSQSPRKEKLLNEVRTIDKAMKRLDYMFWTGSRNAWSIRSIF